VREVMQIAELDRFREIASRVFVDKRVIGYTVRLADATRHPAKYGLEDIAPLIEYGASPRGPIGLAQSARALALLRGRDYATTRDVRDVAADVLRHRLVLSYEALADGISADHVLDRVLAAVDPQDDERPAEATAAARR
jgi:MoxR-like ATPase